ncbi:MAG: hypothetical protein GF317_06415, partial [Candidatus Lokiarchaeota archaeon]|nr:hypothetical protein [Candidatus Lokiarchaeota archaeon]MBD3199355.1 hypothetical protein [Candidatus Lokiarchaeota archaeon]
YRNPCPEPVLSTEFIEIEPSLYEICKDKLNDILIKIERFFEEIAIKLEKNMESILIIILLKKILSQNIQGNFYEYDKKKETESFYWLIENYKLDLIKIFREAKIDENFIVFFVSNEIKVFDKIKNILGIYPRIISVLYSHSFNLNSCGRHRNIKIRKDVAEQLYEKISLKPFLEIIYETYSTVKKKLLNEKKRLPLFEFDNRFQFLDKYYNKIQNRNVYRFIFDKDEEEFLEFFINKGYFYIDIEEMVKIKEDKKEILDVYYKSIKEKETLRIQKNKRDLYNQLMNTELDLFEEVSSTLKKDDIKPIKFLSRSSTILQKLDKLSKDTSYIKKTTNNIALDTSKVDLILESFENLEDLELFLRDKLSSDWEKLKKIFKKLKKGEITRKKFFKKSIKIVGKEIVRVFADRII